MSGVFSSCMVSCYHPREDTRMRVWFLARNHLPFSPSSIHRRQVGGGEIALYYVAKGLAGLGHDVAVINHCGPEAVAMTAFCTMMRRPARPNGRPQRVRSHPT